MLTIVIDFVPVGEGMDSVRPFIDSRLAFATRYLHSFACRPHQMGMFCRRVQQTMLTLAVCLTDLAAF